MKDKKQAHPSQKHEQKSNPQHSASAPSKGSQKHGHESQSQQHSASTPSKGGNSISFERCDYDSKEHLLRAQFKQGTNSITCCINQSVLTELYHCKPSESELKSSFNQHQREISGALLAKIANKQWKVPNKEIQLNAQDLRK